MLANNDKREPRQQINDGLSTQLVFGVDVEGMKPGDAIIVDADAFGYPIQNLGDIPPGDYVVQALLNRWVERPYRGKWPERGIPAHTLRSLYTHLD
jgi:hypothetical protein